MNLVWSVLLGIVIYLDQVLGLPPLASGVSLFLYLLLTVVLNRAKLLSMAGAVYLLIVLWAFGGVWSLLHGDVDLLVFSHILPFPAVIAVRWTFRAMKLSARVPLFLPLALVIVLLPLLTEDPWRLATEAGPRLLLLAAVSVLPLALLLMIRLLRMELDVYLAGAIQAVKSQPDRAVAAYKAMKDSLATKDEKPDETEVQSLLEGSYRLLDKNDQMNAAIKHGAFGLRWYGIGRLLLLCAGVFLGVWFLIYGLAYAAMPVSLAEAWSTKPVITKAFDFLGFRVGLPTGPYVAVSVMLAIVACVAFLGFALTEDQYSEALWRAIVRHPAERYILLAVPYLDLADSATTSAPIQRDEKQKSRRDRRSMKR